MLYEELWVHFYKSYLEMDTVLNKNNWLSNYLWNLATDGVDNNEFDMVIKKLPGEFKKIIDSDIVYNSQSVNSKETFYKMFSKY